MLTRIGLAIMTLMILTKIRPETSAAGYSVLVGIVFFFVVEAVAKTSGQESGLRFKSFAEDLKKPGVLPLVLLPAVIGIASWAIGDLIFSGDFSTHVLSRTGSLLSLEKIPLLVFQVILAAFGEEIAWRGFFVGKGIKLFAFWPCALVSSVLFAAGHIAAGNFAVVCYDVATIFLDSILYALVYKRSGNCLISTAAHVLCNATGIAAVLIHSGLGQ